MINAAYFHTLGETCLRLAHEVEVKDERIAAELITMAEDLTAKANELDTEPPTVGVVGRLRVSGNKKLYQGMIRYFLIGLSLAVAIYVFVSTLSTTVTGHIVYSLSYAFFPAFVAGVFVGIHRLIQAVRGKRESLTAEWHFLWSIFLLGSIAALVLKAVQGH